MKDESAYRCRHSTCGHVFNSNRGYTCPECGWDHCEQIEITVYRMETCNYCDGTGKKLNCYTGDRLSWKEYLKIKAGKVKALVAHGGSVFERKWKNRPGCQFIRDAIKDEKARLKK